MSRHLRVNGDGGESRTGKESDDVNDSKRPPYQMRAAAAYQSLPVDLVGDTLNAQTWNRDLVGPIVDALIGKYPDVDLSTLSIDEVRTDNEIAYHIHARRGLS